MPRRQTDTRKAARVARSPGAPRRRGGNAASLALAAAGLLLAGLAFALAGRSSGSGVAPAHTAPATLAETGLYADFDARIIANGILSFEPQYPLWSDGAEKSRWVLIPPGAVIDASDPDSWHFPAGTKFWKEFRFGRRVETRYIEYVGGTDWIFAAYVWKEDGSEATLAPQRGIRGVAEIADGVRHDIPGYYDCLSCHEGQPNRILGFSALQLSPDRDPLAPHARRPSVQDVDLSDLVRRGLIIGLPHNLLDLPPRIEAVSPRARAALGYLHANCGTCHNLRGPLASLGFSLEAPISVKDGCARSGAGTTAVGRASLFHPATLTTPDPERIAPGQPTASVLIARMSSREPSTQMPPLGTHLVDRDGLAIVNAWIREDLGPDGDIGVLSCR